MDKETLRLIITPTGRLLIDTYREHGETVKWSILRNEYGSKIYQQLYSLALQGLVSIEGEGRDKQVVITDKGKKLVECILNCLG